MVTRRRRLRVWPEEFRYLGLPSAFRQGNTAAAARQPLCWGVGADRSYAARESDRRELNSSPAGLSRERQLVYDSRKYESVGEPNPRRRNHPAPGVLASIRQVCSGRRAAGVMMSEVSSTQGLIAEAPVKRSVRKRS